MHAVSTLMIGAVMFLAVAGCSIQADDAGNVNIRTSLGPAVEENFKWQGRVSPGGAIEIKGVHGDVRAELASGDQIEVTALKSGRRSDPKEVRIEVVEHAGGVTLCAVYPSTGDEPNDCQPGSKGRMNVRDNDVKVEFTVRVPRGIAFVGRSVNGDVAAQGLQGVVTLRTVNGSAQFSTSEYGDAASVNGSITASLGRAGWTEPLEFETVNGSITLDLPANLSAELDATTVNGSIDSEFPITVRGTLSRRRVRGTIGAGGPELSLSSVNGGIRLRRTN